MLSYKYFIQFGLPPKLFLDKSIVISCKLLGRYFMHSAICLIFYESSPKLLQAKFKLKCLNLLGSYLKQTPNHIKL